MFVSTDSTLLFVDVFGSKLPIVNSFKAMITRELSIVKNTRDGFELKFAELSRAGKFASPAETELTLCASIFKSKILPHVKSYINRKFPYFVLFL